MTEPLRLAVVGHTNVGKTSLLRTLTRDIGFGEVSPHPSTTRHVEGARLSVEGEPLLALFDTPGLEDSVALLDYLERLDGPGERLDGPARVERFLAGAEARQRYEQEAKVLRQLLASDAGLYVIDAREPVLAKYRDELEILASCGRPLLPVLNFVSSADQREEQWRQALARLGLHASVRFDSVAPPADGEARLYGSLMLLIEQAQAPLQRLLDDLDAQRQHRASAAARLMAELLIDCAACRRQVGNDAEVQRQAIAELHHAVRQREQRCVEALLQLYAFRQGDAEARDLPLLDGRWGDDLFNPETLRLVGIRVGSGIAAGAAAGAGVDLLVGGITLGAAALAGALAGGAWQTARNYGARLKGKLKGQRELTVDDNVLRLLAVRQQLLCKALDARGHAAIEGIQVTGPADDNWRKQTLPTPLRQARAHPEWSTLNPGHARQSAERDERVDALSKAL